MLIKIYEKNKNILCLFLAFMSISCAILSLVLYSGNLLLKFINPYMAIFK